MFRLSRILKTISSIGFIAILIITYAYLASDQQTYLDARKIFYTDIESFFYYSLGIFIFLHLLFFVFEKVLTSYKGKVKNQSFFISSVFLAWLNAFYISVNILLASYVLFVGFLNSDVTLGLMNYAVLLYIGPIVIVACLILLPVLFYKYR